MLDEFKAYITGGLLIVILGLSIACTFLYKNNNSLRSENSQLTLVASQKQAAAKECSNGVDTIKKEEDAKTENAKVAVAEAKQSSAKDYYRAKEVLTKTSIIVNKTPISSTETNDYLATQQLINEEIDLRTSK
jgi:hypothetical protein